MLVGHGDNLYQYPDIRINFSSNVYNHFNHEGLFRHLKQSFACIQNYPEPTPKSLERDLACRYELREGEVMVTNGATEAIYLVAQAWRRGRSSIMVPTFSEYADACNMHEHNVSYIRSLEELDAASDILWLCNPNNPTGEVLDHALLLDAIKAHPRVLFVIDASYAVFTQRALMSASEAVCLPNVLMLHSMTKEFAIPGLRLGFLTGAASLLERVGKGRMPWSVNSFAQCAGRFLLEHCTAYEIPLRQLLCERRRLAESLTKLGIVCWPSDTHILLCRLPWGSASWLKESLARNYGILIRDASNFVGLDERCFRVAVQVPEENDELLLAIQSLLSSRPEF